MKVEIEYLDNFGPILTDKIEESMKWGCSVVASDEFKYKARKYPERDILINNLDGFPVKIKMLFPETGKNAKRRALFDKEHNTMSLNRTRLPGETKESLAGLMLHEILHKWVDHDEFDIESFPAYVQRELPNMEGKSNLGLKMMLWLYEHKMVKYILIIILAIIIVLMTVSW